MPLYAPNVAAASHRSPPRRAHIGRPDIRGMPGLCAKVKKLTKAWDGMRPAPDGDANRIPPNPECLARHA